MCSDAGDEFVYVHVCGTCRNVHITNADNYKCTSYMYMYIGLHVHKTWDVHGGCYMCIVYFSKPYMYVYIALMYIRMRLTLGVWGEFVYLHDRLASSVLL